MSKYLDEIAPDAIAPDSKEYPSDFKPLDTVIAIHDYPGTQSYSLPLEVGDTVYVLSKSDSGWWDGITKSQNGVFHRGWFPHNYTRSASYNPATHSLSIKAEDVDSITAANTTANSVIPSYSVLLQKNLVQDYSTTPSGSNSRKNSAVSFASSEESTQNEFSIPKESHTKYSEVSISSSFGHSNDIDPKTKVVTVLPAKDVEEMLTGYSVKENGAPIWVPIATIDNNLVFYCEQLGLFCEEAPFISNQELNANTTINYPGKGSLTNVETVKNHSSFSESRDTRTKFGPRSDANIINEKSSRQNSAFSSSASVEEQEVPHYDGVLLADPNLFYVDPTDILTWTGLEQSIEMLLKLTVDALNTQNKPLFLAHFNTTSRLIVLVQLSARLIQNKFTKSNVERSIRKKLKKIGVSIAQLQINASMYLNVDSASGSVGDNSSKASASTIYPDADDIFSESNDQSFTETLTAYLEQALTEIESIKRYTKECISIFLNLMRNETETEKEANMLPQVYPRFLVNEFNGGNWSNPFLSDLPISSAARNNSNLSSLGSGKSGPKLLLDREAYELVKSEVTGYIPLATEVIDILNNQDRFYNDELMEERNTTILRIIYKSLARSTKTIDFMESFDLTVFGMIRRSSSNEQEPVNLAGEFLKDGKQGDRKSASLSFNYPVVLEFFEMKQDFHNAIGSVIMAAQSVTVEDPEVFRGLLEDDPIIYNKKAMEIPSEKLASKLKQILIDQDTTKNGKININTDLELIECLTDVINIAQWGLIIIQQLIEERETILNYATRVMHNDFNVELLVNERNNTLQSDRSEESQTFMPDRRKSRDIPWYLDGDEEYDLAYDAKGNIKGGTDVALVAHLTHHDLLDSSFNVAFLITFPSMMSLSKLVDLLSERFNIVPPEGLSYEEYNTWVEKKLNPIRLRVLNIMKMLSERYWSDVFYDEEVLQKWLRFAKSQAVQKFSFGSILVNDVETILNGGSVVQVRAPILPNEKPPASLSKGYNYKRLKLLDIDYVELARQLTLKEFKLYCQITKIECLSKIWGRKYGFLGETKNIINFITNSNQLTNFVAYMILRKQDMKKRVQVIRFFIQVAEKCRQYNNFSSMTAIISALYSSPIHRLSKTWKIVNQGAMSTLQNMNKLMNSTRNFNEYRDMLNFVQGEPCVPFFGVYLSDLTFTYHGNPDFLHGDNKLINFGKRAKTSEITLNVDKFKTFGYNFSEVKEIQEFIDLWFEKSPTIDEQYSLSLQLEPRETASATLNKYQNSGSAPS